MLPPQFYMGVRGSGASAVCAITCKPTRNIVVVLPVLAIVIRDLCPVAVLLAGFSVTVHTYLDAVSFGVHRV